MPTLSLEDWTALLRRDLAALPREADDAIEVEAGLLARRIRDLAPRRSGALRRSIRVRRDKDGKSVITSSHPGVQTLSTGATISARGGWLRVPLNGRDTSASSGTWTTRGRDGRVYLGLRGSLVALLARRVTIRGSRYLERAAQQQQDGGARVLRRLGLPGVSGG